MAHTPGFEFSETPTSISRKEAFLLIVPAGIQSKDELLASIARAGQFPSYFGGNWDALMDCLRDLSWIDRYMVTILHADLPLRDHKISCRIYLEILHSALATWEQPVNPDAVAPPGNWQYRDHRINVVFPTALENEIASLLADDTMRRDTEDL